LVATASVRGAFAVEGMATVGPAGALAAA
jgi:hypothetical protein